MTFGVSIYCDVSPKDMLDDDTVRLLTRLPFDTLNLNVETSTGERRYSRNQVRGVLSAYPGKLVRPVFWPKPGFDREYVEWVTETCALVGADPILDKEHNWAGVSDALDLASIYHFGNYRLTTHFSHELVRKPARSLASRLAAELEVQALSVYERNGKPVKQGGRLGPGQMQHEAVRIGKATNGKAPWITLPLWDQARWAGGPIPAMTKQLKAAKSAGAAGVSYWSLKHLLRNKYAQEFFENHFRGALR